MDQKNGQPLGTDKNPVVVKPEKPYEKPSILVKWQGPSRLFLPKNASWFLSMFVIAGLVALLLIVMNQWTFALVIIAIAFSIYIMYTVEPLNSEFRITTMGFASGKNKYKYNDLKWFWFEKPYDITVLYIETYLNLPHLMEIPLPKGQEEKLQNDIEEALLRYIPFNDSNRRDVYRWLDQAVDWVAPWVPQSLLSWYTTRFHKA